MKYFFYFLAITSFLYANNSISQNFSENDIIPSEKNPATAFVCSMLIPGLGQMYNEEVGKGFILLCGTLISIPLIYDGNNNMSHTRDAIYSIEYYSGLLMFSISYLYSIIEAPIVANKITKESRIRQAKKLKSSSSIYSNDNHDFSIDLNPYFKNSNLGIEIKIRF